MLLTIEDKRISAEHKILEEPRLLLQVKNRKATLVVRAVFFDRHVDENGRFNMPYPHEDIFRQEIELPEGAELLTVSLEEHLKVTLENE